MGTILIIAGGPIERSFGIDYVNSIGADYVIAADAGLSYCRDAGVLPDRIVGDFDSVPQDVYRYYYEKVPERFERFPAHKDYTDTELALQMAYERPEEQITILGALGGRVDHTLGNIALLKQTLAEGKQCFLADEKNRVRMICSDTVLRRNDLLEGEISLVAFDGPVTGLTLRGFAYEVTDFTLQAATTRGISNEITRETASIELRDGFLLVIESRD